MKCYGQENPNGLQSSNKGKYLLKVNTFYLGIPLCNKFSIVPCHCTMFIMFVLEYPFGTNDILLSWPFSEKAYIIPLELI